MLNINYRDPRPIYEQVKFELRRLILSGVMQPDEKLPSVRELSAQLAINPNTVQRAYRELEGEGYTYSIPGKGSFVAADKQVDQGRVDTLLKQLDDAVNELTAMGLSRDDLAHRVAKGGTAK